MENLVFRSKTLNFDRNTRYFESEILRYYILHLEFEMLGISGEVPSISKRL